eukprot:6527273-Prymnesium_polylepis.2
MENQIVLLHTMWLTIQHRNIWVANRDPTANPQCNAAGCQRDESMRHLAECRFIVRDFWSPITNLMRKLGLRTGHDIHFRLFGRIAGRSYVDKEEAGVLFLAWR